MNRILEILLGLSFLGLILLIGLMIMVRGFFHELRLIWDYIKTEGRSNEGVKVVNPLAFKTKKK